MSGAEKANNNAQQRGGEATEALDTVTGEERTKYEDQKKPNLQDAAEKAKDAAGPPADIALTDYPSPDTVQ